MRAEGFERLLDPDEHLLDVAVTAGLRGIDLSPVPIEVAVQDPKNRDSIRRVLRAVGHELRSDSEISR